MDIPKDILRLMAIELDLPSLIRLCKSNKEINSKVCNDDNFWLIKLNKDFNDWRNFGINEKYREIYKIIYKLTILKEKLGLDYNIEHLFKTRDLKLNEKHLVKLPKEISVLTNLRYLDLSNNNLTELPKEIENLKLNGINLAGNQFSQIPKEILHMPLYHLVLTDNKLKGTIPKELEDIKTLELLFIRSGNSFKYEDIDDLKNQLLNLKVFN